LEIGVLVFVVSYSVLLALYDYGDRDNNTTWNQNITKIKLAIIICFGIEALIRITALGLFIHPNSYLRSGWNIIDICVFFFGYKNLNI
jgi:hypothetical protein